MARGEPNKGLAGKNHPVTDVPFDKDGLANFDQYARVNVKLSEEAANTQNRKIHDREATKILREMIDRGNMPTEIFNLDQLDAIRRGDLKIPNLTWHHHSKEKGVMQLIPEDIHKKTAHQGGFKLWYQNGGEK